MPELAKLVWFLVVKRIFEVRVAVPQLLEEVMLRAHGIEVEGIARGEDDDLLREVAIVGVVKTVYTVVSSRSSPIKPLVLSDLQ
jgi:hypothetical protein